MENIHLKTAQPKECLFGFELCKKEAVTSKNAVLYTLRHVRTGAELLYFDRADENKTFAICFKTLPENDTGVFHILEHSVLNGSKKYPVKEPFVSMLQSSMQTFLNAMTFSDKTLYPVSSRNEQDFFNLTSVYLDAVFQPLIYERPEIFMQEGWHYEFEPEGGAPFYNGVVYSEMKGVFADVDGIIEDEVDRMLFPDNSYGFTSGGHPDHITELTQEQFTATHRRFYHPSNARIFLDGRMDIDAMLKFMDENYLSKYEYRAPDFDFQMQEARPCTKTVCYAAQEGEEALAHMAVAKIFCTHRDVEKMYAAQILADYLTGSNEAPLKRAFLEREFGQDISLDLQSGVYQPSIVLVARNTHSEHFDDIKAFLPEMAARLCAEGLNREDLSASLERLAFSNREISEPYGVILAINALEGWLYGDDPLTHIDTASIFDSLRSKLNTSYFEDLLLEMLGNAEEQSYLYVLPSLTKVQDDAQAEKERIHAATAHWSAAEKQDAQERFGRMQQWQQTPDNAEALASLPHLQLQDVPVEILPTPTQRIDIAGTQVLRVGNDTNGIGYLNLYFDISDLTLEELRQINAISDCFGELRTEHIAADRLQSRIKAIFGKMNAHLYMLSVSGDLQNCKTYLQVSVSMLEENVPAAMELLKELLVYVRYDETDRICETLKQNSYYWKQAMISSGHSFAISKALSAFSEIGTMQELVAGESFLRWHADYTEHFAENVEAHSMQLAALMNRVFARNRLFAGYSGNIDPAALEQLIHALPQSETGDFAPCAISDKDACAIEIPGNVGFSAMGHNLYAMGREYSGACAVLSSMMTYGYLWNMIRVQGGAYGTGMNIRANGDIFCYSYRDPNLKGTRAALNGMADFMQEQLKQGTALNDLIISTVNTTDPLLSPAGVCNMECMRYLKGTKFETVARIRREILSTTEKELAELTDVLRRIAEEGKFCAVGSAEATAFIRAEAD